MIFRKETLFLGFDTIFSDVRVFFIMGFMNLGTSNSIFVTFSILNKRIYLV